MRVKPLVAEPVSLLEERILKTGEWPIAVKFWESEFHDKCDSAAPTEIVDTKFLIVSTHNSLKVFIDKCLLKKI